MGDSHDQESIENKQTREDRHTNFSRLKQTAAKRTTIDQWRSNLTQTYKIWAEGSVSNHFLISLILLVNENNML